MNKSKLRARPNSRLHPMAACTVLHHMNRLLAAAAEPHGRWAALWF